MTPPRRHRLTPPPHIATPQTDAENLPMKTAEYLADNLSDKYDFFFIVRDSTYVRGYRLNELAEDLSVGTDVLLGARDGDSCKLGEYRAASGRSWVRFPVSAFC